MKHKVVLSVIACMLISSQVFANDGIDVSFDRSEQAISVYGSVGAEQDTIVTVSIAKHSGGDISGENLPIYMYLHKTEEEGVLSVTVPTPSDTDSGKYDIYIDSVQGHEKYSVMLVNTEDSETLSAVDEINNAGSQSEVRDILKSKGDKLGIDTEDTLIGEVIDDIAAACYMGHGSYSVDSLCEVISGTISAIESEMLIITSMHNAPSWSYFKDIVMENADKIGIDTGVGSAYSKISEANRYKIFTAMMDDRSGYKTYNDVLKSFNKAVESAKKTTSAAKSGGGGGGGGGGSSSTSGGILPASGRDVAVQPVQTQKPATEPAHEPQKQTVAFPDISGHWGREYIEKLAAEGVVSGYDDNSFRPDNSVIRAEYVQMVTKLFNISESSSGMFDDVKNTDWFYTAVESAANAGLINGNDGGFMPYAYITREDAAVILYRLEDRLDLPEGSSAEFNDDSEISDYAKTAVTKLSSAGIINGDSGMFRPLNLITRAEAAAILCRAAGI